MVCSTGGKGSGTRLGNYFVRLSLWLLALGWRVSFYRSKQQPFHCPLLWTLRWGPGGRVDGSDYQRGPGAFLPGNLACLS